MPVTKAKEEAKPVETAGAGKDGEESESVNFVQVLYIRYLITFGKKSMPVLTLFDSGNEVNTIYLTYARELGLPIRYTDVGTQKIDGIILNI